MSRGFTLAEVLVVLVILGVTAAVVVPALPQLVPTDPLSISASEWIRVLGTARREALNRAETVSGERKERLRGGREGSDTYRRARYRARAFSPAGL